MPTPTTTRRLAPGEAAPEERLLTLMRQLQDEDGGRPDDGIGAPEVARMLGIHRATVYTIRWLRERAFCPVGETGMRWERRVVTMYKAMRTLGQAA